MSIAYDRCGDVICIRVRGFWCRQPCVVCGGKTDGRTHIIAGEFHCQRCCPVHGDAVLQHQERCGRDDQRGLPCQTLVQRSRSVRDQAGLRP